VAVIVRNVFQPYLTDRGWLVTHSILVNGGAAAGPVWARWCYEWGQDRAPHPKVADGRLSVLTTIIDYNAFPRTLQARRSGVGQ
jgi:hypothetical protein